MIFAIFGIACMVTLTLSNSSIEFFKEEAKKHKASYQSMIRHLLDFYVANQKN